MSVEIAWKQNILVTDFLLLKSLLVVFGFGSQTFICEFSRQKICSVTQELSIYKTFPLSTEAEKLKYISCEICSKEGA